MTSADRTDASPVAWVTGGSRGLGAALVRRLVADGWRVAFTYRSEDDAARALEEESAGSAAAFRLDLADRGRPKELVAEVEAALGPIQGLVNNAGVQESALVGFTADTLWDRLVDVNLGGAFRCLRAVLPGMVRRRSGAIVNVASLAALRGVPGQAAYAASKAGLLALTRTTAREVGRRGVRVNAVVPGFVETDMTAELDARTVQRLRSTECLPDGVATASVAGAIAFLLSVDAAAITGQAIVVDAGASA